MEEIINPFLRGRWKVWRDRFQKVKGVSVVHRASDVSLELHTIGMSDEVAREDLCTDLMEVLNGHVRYRDEYLIEKGRRYAAEKMGQQDIEKIQRLEAALHKIIEEDPYMPEDPDDETYQRCKYANHMAQIARIALAGPHEQPD